MIWHRYFIYARDGSRMVRESRGPVVWSGPCETEECAIRFAEAAAKARPDLMPFRVEQKSYERITEAEGYRTRDLGFKVVHTMELY
jgi:hypothetical protein|tara:strand:+ start:4378 stop:4635 length:258 start_codon:yes stop_codon:yes gene_type:complete